MSLLSRLKKQSKIQGTEVLNESKFFREDMVPTDVPMLNVALSGSLKGGLSSGLGVIAGGSKKFKTSYSLIMAAAYLAQKKDSVLLFYDSEFGSPQSYFKTFGIDLSRVLHVPVKHVGELKIDLVNQLENLEESDNVIIIIDSIGNLASKKELEDALSEKSVSDMSRAKDLKSLFRMVTPYLQSKNIPLLAINHVYSEISLYPKDIISGGTGIMYSSNFAWIVGRRQTKEGKEIKGYEFIIKAEKSRFIKEGSQIPISVTFENGVEKYSGLIDVALAGGFVTKPSKGWYQKHDPKTKEAIEGKYRLKETFNADFWDIYLESEEFQAFVEDMYKLEKKSLIDSTSFIEEAVEDGV